MIQYLNEQPPERLRLTLSRLTERVPRLKKFFRGFFDKLLPVETTWKLSVFQGKTYLLKNLEHRLK